MWDLPWVWDTTHHKLVGKRSWQMSDDTCFGVIYSHPNSNMYLVKSDPYANALLTLSVYARQTQQSAQSFSLPCHSVEFDIWHPWLETRSSLSTRAMFTVDVVSSSTFLSRNSCYRCYILPTHPTYCKLLLTDVANMMGKRSVGSRWWSVRPHGVGTLEGGYVHNVPLPRVPRVQRASHMTGTCYSHVPRVPTWSDLTRLLAGLGRCILPFSPVRLV